MQNDLELVKRAIRARGYKQLILKATGKERLEDVPELLMAMMDIARELAGKRSQ